MERFGDYLKTQREKKNIRLEEIASITKIHLHSLELMESNQWEQLPPEPFIRGFITAYAKYVGLDAKETVARYLEAMGQTIVPVAPVQASPETEASRNPNDVIQGTWAFPVKKVLAVGISVGVVLLLGTFVYLGRNQSEETGRITETRPQPPQTETAIAPPVEGTAETSPVPLAAEEERNIASPEAIKAGDKNLTDNKPALNSAVPAEGKETTVAGTRTATSSGVAPTSPVTPPQLPLASAPAPTLAQNSSAPKQVTNPTPGSGNSKVVLGASNGSSTESSATIVKGNEKGKTTSLTSTKKPQELAVASEQNNNASAPSSSEEFKHDVSVEGKARTWIKVVIDDKMPVEYFLPQGEKASYKAKQKIKIVLGDSTGAVVTHNGSVNSGKKFKGTIYSYIFPTNARFPQDPPKRDTSTETETDSQSSTSSRQ